MRPSVVIATLGMLAACGGLAYFHAGRDQPSARSSEEELVQASSSGTTRVAGLSTADLADSVGAAAAGASDTSSSPQLQSSTVADPTAVVASAQPNGADPVAQWIKDTDNADAKVRASAIAALADAPKDRALPALKKVLQVGEPNVDRHIALRSMYSLALRDGDRDSSIRDTMRSAIYHSDDDGVTQTAQSLLDDIEAEFAERTANSQ